MRNSHFMRASAAMLGLSFLLTAGPVIAGDAAKGARADSVRHSGKIVAIDHGTGAITIEEQGPWYGEGTGLKRVTLRLRPDMSATLVERASQAGGDGWPGSFATSSLPLSDLRVGDFITLRTDRTAALSLEVVRPSERDADGRTVVPAASPATQPMDSKQDSKEGSK